MGILNGYVSLPEGKSGLHDIFHGISDLQKSWPKTYRFRSSWAMTVHPPSSCVSSRSTMAFASTRQDPEEDLLEVSPRIWGRWSNLTTCFKWVAQPVTTNLKLYQMPKPSPYKGKYDQWNPSIHAIHPPKSPGLKFKGCSSLPVLQGFHSSPKSCKVPLSP